MHSLRTKITLMTACILVLAMIVGTLFGVAAIKNMANSSAHQTLLLLCEAGQKNLDSYFESVEQSVEMVAAYVESDLDGLDDERLQAHLDRVDGLFMKLSYKTNGVLTYYYRIDPAVSTTAKGFWYVNLDGEGFQEHEVTDITLYDTEDTSSLVWFTVPKFTGEAVWLSPYITDNLEVKVISYNVPVYLEGQFVGVIGIELDYSAMAELVNNITLYENGYAFIDDPDGKIVYHPRMDEQPETPEKILSEDSFIRYNFEGVEKLAVRLPLINGTQLNVTVPVNEINASWRKWGIEMALIFAIVLLVSIFLIMAFTRRIIKPLRELKNMAEQVNAGNYDCHLNYRSKDEVGILTGTFNDMTAHLKKYIGDLNDLAYADALTSLHNKGAFDICVKEMQEQMGETGGALEFAVCVFDCNDLKAVNDQNGHDKGDIYLKETAAIICDVFDHSPVFRIGGDEFVAVLLNRDYDRRDELLQRFDEECVKKRAENTEAWEQVSVARGMAVYDPQEDGTVNDVVRRADKLMYENKWESKERATK